jgi:hypothetical protein
MKYRRLNNTSDVSCVLSSRNRLCLCPFVRLPLPRQLREAAAMKAGFPHATARRTTDGGRDAMDPAADDRAATPTKHEATSGLIGP